MIRALNPWHAQRPTPFARREIIAATIFREVLLHGLTIAVVGTAEQKVPFEVVCLADAVVTGAYAKAYLVLEGEGWKLRSFTRAAASKISSCTQTKWRFSP